jgi:hypothetical protein
MSGILRRRNMKRILIAAALGTTLLGGMSAASAHGLDDLFRLLPHPERTFDRDDHDSHVRWHREARGFDRHDHDRWDRDRHDDHRFDARHDDHRRFDWHRRGRD